MEEAKSRRKDGRQCIQVEPIERQKMIPEVDLRRSKDETFLQSQKQKQRHKDQEKATTTR